MPFLPFHVVLGLTFAVGVRADVLTTSDGVRFGLVGAKQPSPAPTVFFFGGAVEDSWDGPNHREALDILGPGVLKVAVDLPAHGTDRRAGEPASMRGWRNRLDHGEDIVTDFVRRATTVLNFLVEKRYTDPAKVAVFGTSRGGFMAFHFASAEPRVRQVAAFAPVTDLLVLREFFEMRPDNRARALAAARLADRLCQRPIWIVIGSTDHRVSTAQTIEFSQRVVQAAEAHGYPPLIDLHIVPADGHTVPDGSYAAAARWLLKQWASARG
jgi:dienelactone hydrolase